MACGGDCGLGGNGRRSKLMLLLGGCDTGRLGGGRLIKADTGFSSCRLRRCARCGGRRRTGRRVVITCGAGVSKGAAWVFASNRTSSSSYNTPGRLLLAVGGAG